ncbi:MAG: phospholipase [Acidimicrobiaceae bacterium]|jgi:phospholipase C|nr:phospholipase [Acidimicrobiaceae bacterium]
MVRSDSGETPESHSAGRKRAERETADRERAEPGGDGSGRVRGAPEPSDMEQVEPEQDRPRSRFSRRSFLVGGVAAGVTAGVAGLGGIRGRPAAASVDAALSVSPSGTGSLADIEHVVVLMQENRSFDHYFGTLSGVRGFSDRSVPVQTVGGSRYPVFDQFGFQPGVGVDPTGYLQPFHLLSDPPTENGQTTNDITHSWAPQHQSWDNGAMDNFVRAHLAGDGTQNGPVTMGYFTREDIGFYYALADAFTVCDAYHCSVLGPTDPNRLMAMSATIDPEGTAGGPVLVTFTDRLAEWGALNWETMPERLLAAGVSWKVYNDPLGLLTLSPLPYFKAYNDPSSPTGAELYSRAFAPSYPASFQTDVATGTLPAVSWIMPPLAECEHPAAPPEYGEYLVQQVLDTLVSNPEVWARTVLIVTYDENGGFFDHVPPPTSPAGTKGEWLTANPLPAAAGGILGPVGLGFRVPCLVVSPFSAGGYRCSDTLDHTSLLRFLETRFGVEVPNLSPWRRQVTGDLTTALSLHRPPTTAVPPLPATSLGQTDVAEQAVLNALAGTLDVGTPYPLPTVNNMPTQETLPNRPPVPR